MLVLKYMIQYAWFLDVPHECLPVPSNRGDGIVIPSRVLGPVKYMNNIRRLVTEKVQARSKVLLCKVSSFVLACK